MSKALTTMSAETRTFTQKALPRHWHAQLSREEIVGLKKIFAPSSEGLAAGLLRISTFGGRLGVGRCIRPLKEAARGTQRLSGRGFGTLVASCGAQSHSGRIDFRCLEQAVLTWIVFNVQLGSVGNHAGPAPGPYRSLGAQAARRAPPPAQRIIAGGKTHVLQRG